MYILIHILTKYSVMMYEAVKHTQPQPLFVYVLYDTMQRTMQVQSLVLHPGWSFVCLCKCSQSILEIQWAQNPSIRYIVDDPSGFFYAILGMNYYLKCNVLVLIRDIVPWASKNIHWTSSLINAFPFQPHMPA